MLLKQISNISVVLQLPKKIQYRKILVKVVVREFGSYQNIFTTTTFVKFWQFIVFQQLPKKIHHSKILLKVVATSSYQKRQLPKYNCTWVRNLEPGQQSTDGGPILFTYVLSALEQYIRFSIFSQFFSFLRLENVLSPEGTQRKQSSMGSI